MFPAIAGLALTQLFPQKSNTANPNGTTKRKKNPTTSPEVSQATSKTSEKPPILGGFDFNNFDTRQRTALLGLSAIMAGLFGRR